jgi:hypothetical protein
VVPGPRQPTSTVRRLPGDAGSGKRKVVRFLYTCDRDFRSIAIQWARASLRASVRANGYWERVRPHCASHSHAKRSLANPWLVVAWAIRQKREPYEEAYHLAKTPSDAPSGPKR